MGSAPRFWGWSLLGWISVDFSVLEPPGFDLGVLEPPRLDLSVLGPPWLDFGVVEPLGFPELEFGVRKPPWLVTSGAALCPPGLGFAVPRLSFGVWWLGFELQGFQKGFPKPRPEPTARSAVRSRNRRRRRRRRHRRGRRSRHNSTLPMASWHGAALFP